MASRIFSFDFLGSSPKSGSAWTHFQRSVKRRLTTSASGCRSSSSIAISVTSVHQSFLAMTETLLLFDHHITRCVRQRHRQPVELLGHLDLAAEPRGVRQAESEVQHV